MKLGGFEGRFGVLKFEMSLKSEDENLYGDGDGHIGGSSPSIVTLDWELFRLTAVFTKSFFALFFILLFRSFTFCVLRLRERANGKGFV